MATEDLWNSANHFRLFASYLPLPSQIELKRILGLKRVASIFDGRPFQKHPSCQGMDETPGKRIFWLTRPPQEILDDSESLSIIFFQKIQ